MPMAGTPAEYERMALKSIEKAAEDISDTMYHLTRAKIFAALANASANEASDPGRGPDRPAPTSARTPRPQAPGSASGDDGDDSRRHLPAVRVP